MSRRSQQSPLPQAAAKPSPPSPALRSDSVPVGSLRLSGLVKTTNGYAVATAELTPDEWEALMSKRLGRSQGLKQFVAIEHKNVVMKLGQLA